MFRILAIAATLIGVVATAHADVYRWNDAEGRVQYSDKWVPGSVLVKTDKNHPSQQPTPSTDASKLAASNGNIANQQAQQQINQTVKQDVAKSREQDCKEATDAYERAVRSRKLFKLENGQRVDISDAEADAYRAELLKVKKETCPK